MVPRYLVSSILLFVLPATAALRAGAARVDVTPERFPVISNCMFLERMAESAQARLHAKALVLEEGATRVAIVVVDTCMMPRELIDRAKEAARAKTGIPADRMLISATHTHSAPAAMGCLGSDAQAGYDSFLVQRIVEAIERAAARLTPARAGWAVVDDYEDTHCRRWIFRPDKMRTDPFGNITVRANMHPGYQNPDAIAPSGPVDPGLSVLSLQSRDGKPLAVIANYSQHYFGSPILHPDYFGVFSDKIAAKIGADGDFVGMMSQGTSGDQMWMNYGAPKADITLEQYSERVAVKAMEAYGKIRYRDTVNLAMAEARITLQRRVPDARRLEWAKALLAGTNGAKPKNQQEVYAREQMFLKNEPARELKLQAIRIGDLGITAIPNEVFAITGLKIKAQSPLAGTFVVELANGAEGYIPPPAQHGLGGYTTWPARSAGLEVEAEPRITEQVLQLLEKVAGRPRRPVAENHGPYARAVLASRPAAYWRLGEFAGPQAGEATGGQPAAYKGGIAFYVDGPEPERISGGPRNPAVYLAGGRLESSLELKGAYTVEMWFWNGMAADAKLVSVGAGELSLNSQGNLRFGGSAGETSVPLKAWNHVALVRDGARVRVYVNGSSRADIDANTNAAAGGRLVVGGFEGKVDEVAAYSRALAAVEIERHYRTAGR